MKFNEQELRTIKKSLVSRIYHLDQLIMEANETSRKFILKERQECLDLIKYIT